MATASMRSALANLLLAFAILALAQRRADGAISCGQVNSYIGPCAAYVLGRGPLSGACCNGIRGLSGAATTTPDRQAACNCLKGFSGRIRGFNPSLAAGLPGACGVSVPYPISQSVDCSRVR